MTTMTAYVRQTILKMKREPTLPCYVVGLTIVSDGFDSCTHRCIYGCSGTNKCWWHDNLRGYLK